MKNNLVCDMFSWKSNIEIVKQEQEFAKYFNNVFAFITAVPPPGMNVPPPNMFGHPPPIPPRKYVRICLICYDSVTSAINFFI